MRAQDAVDRRFNDATELVGAYDMQVRPTSLHERDRARLKVAAEARDATDLATLLGALGLDEPHEIADLLGRQRTR